jgi:hypothetical protein
MLMCVRIGSVGGGWQMNDAASILIIGHFQRESERCGGRDREEYRLLVTVVRRETECAGVNKNEARFRGIADCRL